MNANKPPEIKKAPLAPFMFVTYKVISWDNFDHF